MEFLVYPEDPIKLFQEGERLCKELEDRKSLATLYNFIGVFHLFKGDPALGRKYQEDSFKEAEKIQDIEIMARVAPSLCGSYLLEGDYKEVLNITPKVIALLERTRKEHELFGLPLNAYSLLQVFLGASMGILGKFTEGELLCKKALSFAHKMNHPFSIGVVELHYGHLYYYKGDGRNAVKHYQSSIEYFEKSQAVHLLPLAWNLLGMGYYYLGELNTALKFSEKGLRMQMDTGMPYGLPWYHWNLSLIHFDLGNWSEAKLHAEQALNLACMTHYKWYEGRSWIQLGRIIGKTDKSRIDKAEEHILQGMKILDELKLKPFYALGYGSLGELYADAGQKEKALENLKKAEGMFREMGMDFWLAKTQEVLGRL